MNKSLISYTPRVRRLNYSAIKNRLGCQSISGTDRYYTKAFIRICVTPG